MLHWWSEQSNVRVTFISFDGQRVKSGFSWKRNFLWHIRCIHLRVNRHRSNLYTLPRYFVTCTHAQQRSTSKHFGVTKVFIAIVCTSFGSCNGTLRKNSWNRKNAIHIQRCISILIPNSKPRFHHRLNK